MIKMDACDKCPHDQDLVLCNVFSMKGYTHSICLDCLQSLAEEKATITAGDLKDHILSEGLRACGWNTGKDGTTHPSLPVVLTRLGDGKFSVEMLSDLHELPNLAPSPVRYHLERNGMHPSPTGGWVRHMDLLHSPQPAHRGW